MAARKDGGFDGATAAFAVLDMLCFLLYIRYDMLVCHQHHRRFGGVVNAWHSNGLKSASPN